MTQGGRGVGDSNRQDWRRQGASDKEGASHATVGWGSIIPEMTGKKDAAADGNPGGGTPGGAGR